MDVYDRFEDSLHGFADLLSPENARFPLLNSVTLHINLLTEGPFEECFDSWRTLDNALNSEKFPLLMNVTLAVKIFSQLVARRCPERETILRLQATHFPLLSSPEAKATFDFSVLVDYF